jgi:hypothetical protein
MLLLMVTDVSFGYRARAPGETGSGVVHHCRALITLRHPDRGEAGQS